MDNLQKIILLSLISTSALAWIASIDPPDMMKAMTAFDPISISLFTTSWTVGMAAMMLPAIAPMVLLYNRLIKNNDPDSRGGIYRGKDSAPSSFVADRKGNAANKYPLFVDHPFKVTLFVGCYLLVWALAGIVLLLGWSTIMNTLVAGLEAKQLDVIYGGLIFISGAYQFSHLKTTCIGYCESPLSFFMRRWKSGIRGAIKMGIYHGMYCLGCCWPYFLLMISLGWMNLIWMGLFSSIIFAEKIWSRGLLVARIAGIVLMTLGFAIMFAPNFHSLLGVGGDMEGNNDSQPMDMKGTMDMVKESADNHQQYSATTALLT